MFQRFSTALAADRIMFPSLHNPFSKKVKSSEEMVLKKRIECLILLGDGILDNFCSIKDPTKDIEHQIADTLRRALRSKSKPNGGNWSDSKEADDSEHEELIPIHNLSVSGLDVEGLLNGMAPAAEHVALRQKYGMTPYPLNGDEADEDRKMYPLELLSAMVAAEDIKVAAKLKDKHHVNPTVVLSVGFGDMVRNLKYGKHELIVEALRKEGFAQNLEKTVGRILNALSLNLIIVIPFEPHESLTRNELHFARDDLLNVMEFVATKLMQIAAKFKCPMIDLSRTLNPFKAEHYGLDGMAPSMESGQFVVDLMMKILAVWDWNDEDRASQIFYGTKSDHDIQCVDNDKAYRASYFNVVQSRALLNDAAIDETEMDLLADLFGGADKDGHSK